VWMYTCAGMCFNGFDFAVGLEIAHSIVPEVISRIVQDMIL